MKADLHIHSSYSDGSASVDDIIRYAARLGLDCIAATDHDTMAGVERAVQTAAKYNIRVLPGIEITTRDYARNRPVHLLCYMPKQTEKLQRYCDATLRSRAEQKLSMVCKIMELYPISPEDVLRYSAGSASVHECHIMQARADMGYTGTVIGPLMKELISSGGSCYVPPRLPGCA